ncbi:MAG: hypothetical protein ACUVV6_08815, partial [Thermoplasmatota archaeon]
LSRPENVSGVGAAAAGAAQRALAPAPPAAPLRHIRCPACKTRIPIYREGPQEITCPGCGRRGPYRPKGTGQQYGAGAVAEPTGSGAPSQGPAPPPAAPALALAGRPAPLSEASRPQPRAPVRMTRCSGCGSQVPIYSSLYPVRITCPGCGRSGVYRGPRTAGG